jgi:hypothetical protein
MIMIFCSLENSPIGWHTNMYIEARTGASGVRAVDDVKPIVGYELSRNTSSKNHFYFWSQDARNRIEIFIYFIKHDWIVKQILVDAKV